MTTMFGGQGQGPTPESRTLTAISESPNPDAQDYASAEKVAELLQRHDYQIKALASGQQQLQKGVNDATQNPLQQMQQFVSDIIVLLGGGQLVEGTLDFGDLQYILPALGALFGFGDGPFPINLFNAAEKFFLGYVVPGQQFADVINNIIGGWMNLFGFDPKFIKDLKALVTSIGDLFGGIENLFTGLDSLFGALGLSGGDMGPLGQLLAPILKLFTGIDLKNVGSILEFITAAIDPFVVDLTAVINFIDEVLAIMGFSGGSVVNSPIGDATSPFANLMDFLTSILSIFDLGGVVDGSSGLGLGNLLSLPATFLNDALGILGLGTISDSADPFANILALPQDIINTLLGFLSGGTLGTGGIGDLTGLLDNIPLIGPLIEALTGGNVLGGAGLSGLAGFFDFGSGFDSIIAVIESVVGNIPIVGPLIDTFLSFLTGGTTTSGDLTDLASLLGNIPLIGPLLEALTGSSTTGGGGLLGLGSVFTDLFGLLGNPTGLGTGAPALASDLASIPIIGPVVSTLMSFLSGGSITSGGTDILSSLLGQIPLIGPLLEALTGSSTTGGGGLGGLGSFFTDILGLLGGASGAGSGSFDIIGTAEQWLSDVLTPAGALTTQTQLPAHLFGNLAPNNLTNMLPDPGFDNANYFEGNEIFFWDGTVDHTGKVGSGSARTAANGSVRRLVGVPIGANGGDTITLGGWAYWQGLSATAGQTAIILSAKAYDGSGNEIVNTLGPLAWIVNPTLNSATFPGAPSQQPPIPAADSKGWVQMTGDYKAPDGTSYVAITIELTGAANVGTVWFDDLTYITRSGFIDAGWIGNLSNFAGNIPLDVVGGIQDIENMLSAFQFHIDGLGSAFSGSQVIDLGLPDLFSLAQGLFDFATNAFGLASDTTVKVNNKINKQATTAGLQPSGEANFSISDLPHGALPTTTLPTGNAMGGWVRIGQDASKGFLDMLLAKAAGATGIYLNLYSHNPATGTRTKIWPNPGTTTGSDISAEVPDTTINHAQVLFPGGVDVTANEAVWAEIVNNSGSNMTVVAKNTAIPDHFNTQPKNYGMTRAAAALGVSPTTITDTQATSSATAPVMTLGIAVVPADYHAPETAKFTSGAGDYVYNIPSWVKVGDYIDLVDVGAGGSGQSEWDAGIMQGGLGGSWSGRRLVYGVDIPAGTTQLNVRVGAGGPQAGSYWADGNPGSPTQWWLGPIGTGTKLLEAAGGPGGTGGVGLDAGTGYGPTPNPYQFQGRNYFGGGNVGINATGSNPGGGGGGATWYQFGGKGGPGGAFATAIRPVAT